MCYAEFASTVAVGWSEYFAIVYEALFAFVLVSIAVLVLRRTQPDLPRAFRVPPSVWSRRWRCSRAST